MPLKEGWEQDSNEMQIFNDLATSAYEEIESTETLFIKGVCKRAIDEINRNGGDV